MSWSSAACSGGAAGSMPAWRRPQPACPGRRADPGALRGAQRGGREVMVEVADIDWVEAAGNYAILHVGGDTFEIRSSLSKLEGELDPQALRAGPQILRGEHRPDRGSDAVDQRRLAHPPAGRRRGEPQPPLPPALRDRWCRSRADPGSSLLGARHSSGASFVFGLPTPMGALEWRAPRKDRSSQRPRRSSHEPRRSSQFQRCIKGLAR